MLKLVLLLAVVAGVAYSTKPGEAEAEDTLREQLILAVAKAELGEGRSAGQNMALAVCKMRPSDCYEIVRPEIATVYSDFVLFSRITLDGLGQTATCYGLFTTFICLGGLKDV